MKIFFVHGFGVKKDARGMFKEISTELIKEKGLLEEDFVFTDLNKITEDGDVVINRLSTQADILSNEYTKHNNSGQDNIVIAHSQGCVVTALANLSKVSKIILLAPPTNNDINKTIKSFEQRTGSSVDTNGTSVLMRSDGSKSIVPKEYWDNRDNLDYLEEYKKLSSINKLLVVFAKQDKIVSNENTAAFSKMGEVIEIDGNHDFEGKGRELMIKQIECFLF